ncbi:GAF domain-containing protein [Sphingomonas sp. A2-49]|uniref:sensor histidine kinase n=1 Tax=Sphingomonas sp. A2-49 TaxID=1391375 RepID=UPI0021CF99AD|nr:histidine kinase dimerization/phosphoacceptor domain -containing protein [Sphingomonas sp. A2-49]MCU6452676.1 GAF domain-containing protein [Sphingomonas sp. A2-49]
MAVVEQAPGDSETPGSDELQYRLQQQSVLAKFGIEALRARDLQPMLQRAVELCAQGMRSRYCKLLEHCQHKDALLVRSGVGWRDGVVGSVEMRADLGSPAGYAYHTGEAVISNHLGNETRFRTPAFMADHQIRRAINVLVEAGGRRFGVLEVDSPDEGKFEASDLAFMQGFANLIGVAIERQEAERRLNDALQHQELLTREASHRVKNSLAMVSGLLNLQMQADPDERITRLLGDAQARITAIALAHDRLWRGDQVGIVALDDLIGGIVEQMREQAPGHSIHCDVARVQISADTAIPIGLLVTELVTNAIKYAYDDGGDIEVRIAEGDDGLHLAVRDHGVGLPEGFDPKSASSRSLGMRMIVSLARQLRGELLYEDAGPGTRAVLAMPDPRRA